MFFIQSNDRGISQLRFSPFPVMMINEPLLVLLDKSEITWALVMACKPSSTTKPVPRKLTGENVISGKSLFQQLPV